MEYKGYVARIEFDESANVFHGQVLNLRDVITFEGESVTELEKAFRDSVDDYLDFCASRNEEPEKPFSGKFLVRVDPSLHRRAAIAAGRVGESLNSWVGRAIERMLEQPRQSYDVDTEFARVFRTVARRQTRVKLTAPERYQQHIVFTSSLGMPEHASSSWADALIFSTGGEYERTHS